MKNYVVQFLLLALASVLTSCGSGEQWAKSYYVSQGGNDQNSGDQSAPFATLERARDEIRKLKATGPLPEGGIQVVLEEGTYTRTETFTLTVEDSGTDLCPIVYKGVSKESVRFLGGVALTEWKPVTAPEVLSRFDSAVRDKVVQCDLKKTGVMDFGTVASLQAENSRADLFCNGEYMSLARYPDAGEWARVADVPMSGPKRYFYDGITHYGRFTYEGNRPSHWKDQSDLWVQGYWVHDWRDGIHRIEKIDTLKHEIYPEPPYHHYGYRKGQRYFFLNVLEELTQPGEWYLDRSSGILYFYPPTEIAQAEVIFAELQKPMIVLEGVSNVAIEGITFQASRDGAIVMNEGSNNQIRGCHFLNLGHLAIDVREGSGNQVISCDLHDLAQGAISITGGDRKTLTPSGHVIENCDISRNGVIFKTQTPAILMKGVGIRVAHCYVHDTPHTGIFYYGNDHIFEYCEFTRIATETGDVGCIYTMADWTFLGNIVRYNYFHHIHSPGHLGCFVVYPDLPNGGMHVHGNVFYDIDRVFHTNSGRGMLIENNLMLQTDGLSYKIWPFRKIFFPGGAWQIVEHMEEVNYNQPPYVTRYPMLEQLAKDMQQTDSTRLMERQLCKDNLIRNNIATGDVFMRFIGEVDFSQVKIEGNLIASDVAYSHSPINQYDDFNSYTNDAPEAIRQLEAAGNILMKGDPGIKDPAQGDFGFVAGSAASQMKFDPIPFDKIGLQKDTFRK